MCDRYSRVMRPAGPERVRGIPFDYDADPGRFRANVLAVERYGLAGDVHQAVAERAVEEVGGLALDLGCGEGRLVREQCKRGVSVIAYDLSATMLAAVRGSRTRGDATRLPFRDRSFGVVAALYMLYHLADPRVAIAESYRVLQPGGLFAACAPSRHSDPELARALPPASPSTFDAENGPDLVADFFDEIEVQCWDAALVHLPDRPALALYLRGRGLSETEIADAVDRIATPLTLTKRGALVYGRKAA